MGVLIAELLDDGHQCFSLRVLHLDCTNITIPLHHSENRSLCLGASALCSLHLLGFVLVDFPATEIHFIQLNLSSQCRRVVLLEQCSYLMENEPSGFLCDFNVASQLAGRNTFLVAADKVHGKEPLAERNLRVLKDCPNGNGKVLLASGAVETSVSTGGAMMFATERAYDVAFLPSIVEEDLTAFLLAVEVGSEFEDIVEVVEVNHNSQVFSNLY